MREGRPRLFVRGSLAEVEVFEEGAWILCVSFTPYRARTRILVFNVWNFSV